jgi:hypothetical protein
VLLGTWERRSSTDFASVAYTSLFSCLEKRPVGQSTRHYTSQYERHFQQNRVSCLLCNCRGICAIRILVPSELIKLINSQSPPLSIPSLTSKSTPHIELRFLFSLLGRQPSGLRVVVFVPVASHQPCTKIPLTSVCKCILLDSPLHGEIGNHHRREPK